MAKGREEAVAEICMPGSRVLYPSDRSIMAPCSCRKTARQLRQEHIDCHPRGQVASAYGHDSTRGSHAAAASRGEVQVVLQQPAACPSGKSPHCWCWHCSVRGFTVACAWLWCNHLPHPQAWTGSYTALVWVFHSMNHAICL